MPIIKSSGLLGGERLAALSDEARLYWPFIYAASNGYCRFRIDYLAILNKAFGQFANKPSEEKIRAVLAEYRDQYLLFIYRAADGSVWGAWDSVVGQRYFSAEDKASPAPPKDEFLAWQEAYQNKKHGIFGHASDSLGDSLLSTGCELGKIPAAKIGDFSSKNPDFFAKPPSTPTPTSTHTSTPVFTSTPTPDQEFREKEEIERGEEASASPSPPFAESVLGPVLVRPTPTGARQRTIEDAEAAEFEQWAEAVYARHPKKTYKHLALRALTMRFARDKPAREIFDKHHPQFIATDSWQEREGALVPPLARLDGSGFIADEAWLHPPPKAVVRSKKRADTSFLDELIEKGKKHGTG